MNNKSFLVLAGVTAAAVIVAAVLVARQPSLQGADVSGELVFPKLLNDINRLKTVVVKSKEGTYTLDWNGQAWTFRERDGYAADDKKINEMLLRIARMQKLEGKTALESRYDRLDVQAPDAKDSRAKQVTILDKDGKPLADLVIGKRKFTLGAKEGGTYIRVPGDAQAWLALGEVNPGEKARDWLKRDIADIKDKDIKRVTVTHPNGEKVVAAKTKPEDTSFKIQGIPAGKEPATDFVADEFGRVLTAMLLDDVKKAADVKLPPDKTIKAEFEGFAGFKVYVDLAEVDGKNWVKVRADYTAAAPAPAAKTTTPPPSAAAAPDAAPNAEAAVDWAKTVADLNARTDGWVFEVPAYEVAPLKKRMAEVTKKAEPKT